VLISFIQHGDQFAFGHELVDARVVDHVVDDLERHHRTKVENGRLICLRAWRARRRAATCRHPADEVEREDP
jgi:hypothetical protein